MPLPVRARVLGFAFLLAVVTYLDRVCISAAAPFIMEDLHLSVLADERRLQRVHARVLAVRNSVGLAGRRQGPRRVLTRIVLWWSAFTMLTGARAGFHRWSRSASCSAPGKPARFRTSRGASRAGFRRASAAGPTACMFLGSRLGGMLSAPIALLLDRALGLARQLRGLRRAGHRLGGGVVRVVSRSARRASGGRCREELAWIQQDGRAPDRRHAAPARRGARCLRSRNLYAICAMYFAFGYGLVLLLHVAADLSDQRARVLAARRRVLLPSLPFLLAGHADLAGGWLHRSPVARRTACARRAAPRVRRVRHVRGADRSRRRCAAQRSPRRCCSRWRWRPPISRSARAGRCPIDIAPNHAGVITGFMNTFGNLGGLVGPLVVG